MSLIRSPLEDDDLEWVYEERTPSIENVQQSTINLVNVSEHEIIREVMNMLRGLKNGRLFVYNSSKRQFDTTLISKATNITTKMLLRNKLNRFIILGTKMEFISNFVQNRMVGLSILPKEKEYYTNQISLTMEAFYAAILEEIDRIHKAFYAIEWLNENKDNQKKPLTVIGLFEKLLPVEKKVDVMASIINDFKMALPHLDNNVQLISSYILSVIYSLVRENQLTSLKYHESDAYNPYIKSAQTASHQYMEDEPMMRERSIEYTNEYLQYTLVPEGHSVVIPQENEIGCNDDSMFRKEESGDVTLYELTYRLFHKTVQPYLNLLDEWIFHGDLSNDVYHEFFLRHNKRVKKESSYYWTDYYSFNENAVPSFLKNIASMIIDLGKSIHLIKHLEFQKSEMIRRDTNQVQNLGAYVLDLKRPSLSVAYMNTLKRLLNLEDRDIHSALSTPYHLSSPSKNDLKNAHSTQRTSFTPATLKYIAPVGSIHYVSPSRNFEPISNSGSPRLFQASDPKPVEAPKIFELHTLEQHLLGSVNMFGTDSRNDVQENLDNEYFSSQYHPSLNQVQQDEVSQSDILQLLNTDVNTMDESIQPLDEDLMNALHESNRPIDLLIQKSIDAHIYEQSNIVGPYIITLFLQQCHAVEHLTALRAFYFFEYSDIMDEFIREVTHVQQQQAHPVSKMDLNALFTESCQYAIQHPREYTAFHPTSEKVKKYVLFHHSGDSTTYENPLMMNMHYDQQAQIEQREGSIQATNRLSIVGVDKRSKWVDQNAPFKLHYRVEFPLNILISRDVLHDYHEIFWFLFQIKRAKFHLDDLRVPRQLQYMASHTCQKALNKLYFLLFKMRHFINTLLDYEMHTALDPWPELCESLMLTDSFNEFLSLHRKYLSTIHSRCLFTEKSVWLVRKNIRKIITLALQLSEECNAYFAQWEPFISNTDAMLDQDMIDQSHDEALLKSLMKYENQFRRFHKQLMDLIQITLSKTKEPSKMMLSLEVLLNYNNFYIQDT